MFYYKISVFNTNKIWLIFFKIYFNYCIIVEFSNYEKNKFLECFSDFKYLHQRISQIKIFYLRKPYCISSLIHYRWCITTSFAKLYVLTKQILHKIFESNLYNKSWYWINILSILIWIFRSADSAFLITEEQSMLLKEKYTLCCLLFIYANFGKP